MAWERRVVGYLETPGAGADRPPAPARRPLRPPPRAQGPPTPGARCAPCCLSALCLRGLVARRGAFSTSSPVHQVKCSRIYCSKKWSEHHETPYIILFGRWSMAGNAEAARAPSPVGGQAAPPFCCYSTPGALPGLPEAATMRTSALGESASPPAGSAGRRCRGDGDSWPRPGAAVPTTAR